MKNPINREKSVIDEKIIDANIVKKVLHDPNEYRHLIEKYQLKLLRYIRRILYVSKEDAEDILQEVFIKAYRNIQGYDSKYSFSSWIYRIAHNEAVTFLRKNKNIVTNTESENIFDYLPSNFDLEDDFLSSLRSSEVRDILKKLDKKYREVLILRFFEEMGYNQISEVLHISEGTVASLINRGKKKFKLLLERYGKNI